MARRARTAPARRPLRQTGLAAGRSGDLTTLAVQFSGWPLRRWLVALLAAAASALAIGVPTGVVPTSFYTRMTPLVWWDYLFWSAAAVSLGLIAATYVRTGSQPGDGGGRAFGGGILSTIAVGCPICNKIVVALLGVGGALQFWAPLQPVIGGASLVLLLATLALRLRGERGCAVTRISG